MRNNEASGHLPVESPWRYKLAGILTSPIAIRGVEVSGIENLPDSDEPFILAANHRSNADTMVLGRFFLKHDGTQIHFVTKSQLTDAPILGNYVKKSGGIRFDRALTVNEQPGLLGAMGHVLQNKGVLGMFPEHTRREGPELQVEKPGLGGLAARNSVKIVNVGIFGTESLWQPIHMHIGEATEPTELVDGVVRRKRPAQFESEYKASLQESVYRAYELGGGKDILTRHLADLGGEQPQ